MKTKKYFIFILILLAACANKNYYKDIGYKYLGTRYLSDPLGEEKLPDTDSLIRYDAFDCTTFVETSLANGNKTKLNNIRYKDGKIDFLNRNHFIEYDWVNNNSDLVYNVSRLYGKTKVRSVNIDKKNWFKKTHNIDTNFSVVKTKIEYIPYSELKPINNKNPLMILFIMDNPKIQNEIGTDLAVSHMGFLMPNGVLRHASVDKGEVVDMNFAEYVKIRKNNKVNLGVALYKIK